MLHRFKFVPGLIETSKTIQVHESAYIFGIGQEEVKWLQDADESFDMSVFFPHEEAEAELTCFIERLSTSWM